jgi:D-alanyl-lipoteichoic acid acyltransferase DltB (MBOAT superfamily)
VVFNSLQFALFLPVVWVAYWAIGKRRPQNVLLLLASWFFYAMWDWRFLGLMWLTTVVDFGVGRYLAHHDDERSRKIAFTISLVLNLTVLGFFKYFNFFVDSASELLTSVGLENSQPTLQILLPIGISFYTFHGISYTFDVFRRDIEPADDFLDFAVFVAYFPQLVAGPIGRAQIQLPQFENERPRLTWDQARSGMALILLGLFKKVVIADAIAPYVNEAFTNADSASWATLVAGAYGFALQIYGDFSGYSDIARGTSRLFAIELPLNFEQPYLSRNITVFWRTWHISLSNWLRDYLYIPLGGNRGSAFGTYRNLMLTMLIGGLWHGAAWTFVAWGGLHGLYLCVHRAYQERFGVSPVYNRPGRFTVREIVPAVITFQFVCLAWIFFRAESFTQAFDVISGIFTLRGSGIDGAFLAMLVLLLAVSTWIDLAQRNRATQTPMLALNPAAQGALYGVFIVAIILFSGAEHVPFIYFQF